MLNKLLEIQKELKVPKTHFNAFGDYNYRNAEDILEAVKPLCAKHKVVLTLSDKINQVGDRYYVEATARLMDCESDKEISVTASARETQEKKKYDEAQLTGAASSYARKYALNGLFDLDDTKDADATNKGEEPLANPRQIELLTDLVNAKNKSVNGILKKYQVDDLHELTSSQIEYCIKAIQQV